MRKMFYKIDLRMGFGAEAFSKWVLERTEINIKVYRPPNYTKALIIAAVVVLVRLASLIKNEYKRLFLGDLCYSSQVTMLMTNRL